MEAQKSVTKNWIYCFLWTGLMVYMLINPAARPFFWLALPGAATHFALGLRLI